jgi:leader peptidase (prepilin peptidase)/N-methyltransferase
MFDTVANLLASTGLIYLLLVSWPLARIDIAERRLPNKYVLPAFPVTWIGQFFSGLLFQTWENLLISFVCSLLVFGLALGVNQVALLGMGDVKLMTVMAASLSWYSPFLPMVALVATFLFAGIVALWLLITRKLSLGGSMPLGPYLISGFVAALTWGAWS